MLDATVQSLWGPGCGEGGRPAFDPTADPSLCGSVERIPIPRLKGEKLLGEGEGGEQNGKKGLRRKWCLC
jgi:hypothetical protein